MEISYLGHSSFKLKYKTANVVTDPFDPKMVGLKYSGVEAEIVTVSHFHADHNSTDKIASTKKILDGPGEYEVAGISVMGYPTFHDNKKGEERGKNTIYIFEAEGLRIAHFGDLGHILNDNLYDEIGDIDVLMLPVGGFYTIGPKEAVEIVTKVEPSFVIPMHYAVEGMNSDIKEKLLPVDDFLKESGLIVETLPKFTLKKEDINDEQTTKVIVLERK